MSACYPSADAVLQCYAIELTSVFLFLPLLHVMLAV